MGTKGAQIMIQEKNRAVSRVLRHPIEPDPLSTFYLLRHLLLERMSFISNSVRQQAEVPD